PPPPPRVGRPSARGDRPATADRYPGRGAQRRAGAVRRVRGRRRPAVVLLCAARRPWHGGGDDLDQRQARHEGVREAGLRGAQPLESVDRGGGSDPTGTGAGRRATKPVQMVKREEERDPTGAGAGRRAGGVGDVIWRRDDPAPAAADLPAAPGDAGSDEREETTRTDSGRAG